jgi:hypothetical protein
MSRDCVRPGRRGRLLWRAAIPAAALGAFVFLGLLWAAGQQGVVLSVIRFLRVEPGPIPFLDAHAILAAAECHSRGIDVYTSNPCDLLGRPHVYSPLWITVLPGWFDTALTPWIGITLALLFLSSLFVLLRPRNLPEAAIFALAVFSPMTVYALERANNDAVIFLLLLCAGLLHGAARKWRLCSYPIILAAALLKYYPAVLFGLALRERRRDAVLVLGGAIVAVALFAVAYGADIVRALAIIPAASYFTDSFSAKNLPFGMLAGLPQVQPAAPVALGLLAIMVVFALARTGRTVRLLEPPGPAWDGSEMRFAALGGLLLTACFFAGQNVNYRGIYFLMVLPGLLSLRSSAADGPVRRWASLMVAAVLFVMWGEFLRRGLAGAVADRAGFQSLNPVFWVLRELVWWWLVAGMAALCTVHLRHVAAPEFAAAAARFGWLWPAAGRNLATAATTRRSAGR